MIGHRQFTEATLESFGEHGGNSRASLAALGFDNRAVEDRAERVLAYYSDSETPPEVACKAAFVFGLELGYRIAMRQARAR